MQLSFSSIALRSLCEDPGRPRHDLPADVVAALQDRIADLRAATCWSDLQFGGPQIDIQSPGYLRWSLGTNYELLCSGGHPNPPLQSDGTINQSRLRRVRLEQVRKNDFK